MKILIGSQAFFNDYTDFNPHDTDYVLFENNPILYKTFAHIRNKEGDIFAYKLMSKEEFIEYELEHCKKAGMAIAKLLVPGVCEYMNLTIDDLKIFKFATEHIKEKHNYITMIYNFYLENNGIYLTLEQRDLAYKEYKKYR